MTFRRFSGVRHAAVDRADCQSFSVSVENVVLRLRLRCRVDRLYCRVMTKLNANKCAQARDRLSAQENYRRAVQEQFASFERRERARLSEERNERAQQLQARLSLPGLDSFKST
jgi:hypothetical protein